MVIMESYIVGFLNNYRKNEDYFVFPDDLLKVPCFFP